MTECSVMVGVRIRPFNDREKNLNAKLCVAMEGPKTILQPVDVEDEEKTFAFDASFWSHDGFEDDDRGYSRALPGSSYADQAQVFGVFGKTVLANAWAGYHCCLFAYGQTGAGKSYSMVGYGENKGIVPMACEEIFSRIASNQDPSITYEVTVSMVEIYNEQVQDLLVSPKDRPKKGLEIRESQQLGIYIDGVRKRAVDSYAAIESVMDEGTENRTVGSTLMNATSSRAHTVISIELRQVSKAGGQQGCKLSLIKLVDLAGSEKAGQTGASGDRLKEGCAINKSLSALGNVIEKLADQASGKGKPGAIIPYRDSKLTRLLQNALGGSSKTIMICAISPASSNHEETLSTLRYADRAKRIKNSAVVNENPQDQMIRQLREENMKLRSLIDNAAPSASGGGEEAAAQEALADKQAEVSALEQALAEMQKSFQDRLSDARRETVKKKKQKEESLDLPHIANLNEDQLLTNKLRFAFPIGEARIGRSAAEGPQPQVALAGPGIHEEHATVVNTDGACVLSPASDEAAASTFVNGDSLEGGKGGTTLAHGDRVAFGQCIFVFVDPAAGSAAELLKSGKVDYAMARKELLHHQGGVSGPSEQELEENRAMAEELERRVREAEEAKARAKSEAEARLHEREEEFQRQLELKQQEWEREKEEQQAQTVASDQAAVAEHARELERLQREFEERQKQAEEENNRRIKDLEKRAQKAATEEEDHRQHEHCMQKLEEDLMFVMPLVKEANLICAELQRNRRLETKMHCELSKKGARGSVNVTAAVFEGDVQLFEWTPETLENRVYLLRELLHQAEEEGLEAVSGLSNEYDPLWDPIQVERLIGVSQILLEGLLLQVEHEFDARILSTEGHQAGVLRVEISPLGSDGSVGIPDSEAVDDPQELLGQRMAILVHIVHATGLPEALANDVWAEYSYFLDAKPYKVPPAVGHCRDPVFDYKHTFVQDPVTTPFLKYLESKLLVRVYGRDISAVAMAEQLATAAATPDSPKVTETAPVSPEAAGTAEADNFGGAALEGDLGGEALQGPAAFALRQRSKGQQASQSSGARHGAAEQGEQTAAPPTLSQVRRQQNEVTTSTPPFEGGKDNKTKSKNCSIM
mmetsp:Transcript_115556/g.327465  ORF Transcript_115556/g.327465 Transcript_115556/m.327465 type:complete len:1101 (-) Transcript_115556:158-3460(-)